MHATRKLARFLRPYRRWAILAPLLMVLEVTMDLLQPRLIQRLVDQGIVRGDMNVVLTTGAWMAGLAVIGLAGGMGCTVFAILAGQSFGADLRGTLFRRVQALSFANLDRLETGALITRLTSDVTQVQELVMMVLRVMVRAPLLLVGSLLMAVLTSPQLALLFLALIPIVLVILRWVIVRAYPLFGQVQRRLDTLTTVMQENLAGVRVVKAFARTTHEAGRFRHANDALMDRNVAAVQVNAATMPLMMLTLNAGVVGAVWIGGVRVSAGSLQVGELIAFINYLMQTLMALMTVSMLVMRVSRAEASADRIEGVLTSEPAVKTAPDALTTFAPRGRVAFEDVTFSYSGDDHDPALAGISFVAEPGQTVAILGATGAGKSSLVNLIPRFYDVTAGRVTLDGVDVRAIDEVALRAAVGVALQESILFSGAIRDNIRYGRPEATEAEVIAAARVAQAHDFIMRLPMGYDAVVGQRGVNLSGGQKQRLAIARALLTRPAVLIFDDSTSAVDVATEARIQTALAELGQQQTRFIVAQRISTVLTADKILVLDNGRLVAAGTHNELLATNPLYREIYDSQLESGTVAHGAA
ncbi:MAG TPA: ABC transporter ATP-binding protein [Thermomicrobiales bacterium]|nr:ABC transporter ATP-binding protein [Thermomicrobiales bacterium]